MKNPTIRRSNDPFAALILPSAALSPTPPPAPRRRLDGTTVWAWLHRTVERWARGARQRELERVLASATDITDVERRLRALERGTLHRYY